MSGVLLVNMSQETVKAKQRVLVVAPGRGSYNKSELGYLHRYHEDKKSFISKIDTFRESVNQPSIAQLDALSQYSLKVHSPGYNASALIYACAMSDFMDIDRDKYEIVAVTGNSMGWYIALALAGGLDENAAIKVINTMGSMMSDDLIGGQLIYPVMDSHWRINQNTVDHLDSVIKTVNSNEGYQLYTSIYLGGYRVLAGDNAGLKLAGHLLHHIDDKYPMRLYNHGAFHSPLLGDIATKAKTILSSNLFARPKVPMIDGEGNIWTQHSTDPIKLYDYTLTHQVITPYNFSLAIEVGIKEFAPDKVIILGPGNTLGGPVAQSIIDVQGFGWRDKADFISAQEIKPKILAMGHKAQRKLAINSFNIKGV
jgi:malonyl CoA-acyl carrier protein transacylase|tara:strand:+ start:4516 stop:5619 length:1104 start_codon:yes stop_codon:yes gene_type:complete